MLHCFRVELSDKEFSIIKKWALDNGVIITSRNQIFEDFVKFYLNHEFLKNYTNV